MNSFTLTAVGNLARNPELVAKNDSSYARFCLVGNDYAGKDDEGAAREVVTSLWFVAFGAMGEALARNARKGDQLFIEARVRASNWTDKQGEKQYDHSFIIVENCGNTLILRCSGSEHGGTSQFASRLIGEREVIRRHTSRGRDRESWFAARGARRSTSVSEQRVTEMAVLPSELEQLPDLTGYLKAASSPVWLRVKVRRGA